MQPADGNCSFSKANRLASPLAISNLMEKHYTVFCFPIKCCYRLVDVENDKNQPDAKLAVIVPKRRFKHAVDRNRVKRLMRESYRIRKFSFDNQFEKAKQLQMCWIYVHDELPNYQTIEKAAVAILEQITKKLTKSLS